jgi:hypothetical protein
MGKGGHVLPPPPHCRRSCISGELQAWVCQFQGPFCFSGDFNNPSGSFLCSLLCACRSVNRGGDFPCKCSTRVTGKGVHLLWACIVRSATAMPILSVLHQRPTKTTEFALTEVRRVRWPRLPKSKWTIQTNSVALSPQVNYTD